MVFVSMLLVQKFLEEISTDDMLEAAFLGQFG